MKIYKIKYTMDGCKFDGKGTETRMFACASDDDALIELRNELSLRYNHETIESLHVIYCNLK